MSWPVTSIIFLQPGHNTKVDLMETTDGEQNSFVSITSDFSKLSESLCFGSYAWTIIGPVLEVHIVKILLRIWNRSRNSINCNPTYTSHVAKSRETERLVNEIHDHNEELRSNNELLTQLQGSAKSEACEERRRSLSNKEIRIRLKEHPCTHKEPFLQMRIHQMEDIEQLLYPRWLQKMLRHYDQERQNWGFKTLMRAFAQEEARDFDDGHWSTLIHEGSNEMRIEYCDDKKWISLWFASYSGTLWEYSNKSELMNYTFLPCNWKQHVHHRGFFNLFFGSGFIPER